MHLLVVPSMVPLPLAPYHRVRWPLAPLRQPQMHGRRAWSRPVFAPARRSSYGREGRMTVRISWDIKCLERSRHCRECFGGFSFPHSGLGDAVGLALDNPHSITLRQDGSVAALVLALTPTFSPAHHHPCIHSATPSPRKIISVLTIALV